MLVNVIQLAMTENLIVLLESDEKNKCGYCGIYFYLSDQIFFNQTP